MKKNERARRLRGRIAVVGAAAAVSMAFGSGITSAYAERVIQSADGQAIEQSQAGESGQEGIEVVDATNERDEDKTSELGVTEAEGEREADTDAAPEGPKVAPQLDIKGPKVSDDPNAKYPSIDAPKVVVNAPKRDYIDESGKPATSPVPCTDLSSSKTGWLPLKAGWYCFTKDTTLEGRAAITGDVRIIVCDGVKVTWNGGLHVGDDNKLTIYGQKEGTGELVADVTRYKNGAAIGGGSEQGTGDITICGCRVTAKAHGSAAGIGNGFNSFGSGSIRIVGAQVNATATDGAAAIGSGVEGAPPTITIEKSKVTAKANAGAGIGAGSGRWCRTITIKDSVVEASSVSGAGIGGGSDSGGGDIRIEGDSRVDAKSERGGALGRGASGNSVGKLRLDDHFMVISCDDGNKKVPTDERVPYCLYRNHVKVEPCDHDGATYQQVEGGHKAHCKHCKGDLEVSEHHFDASGVCAECGAEAPNPAFVDPTWEASDRIALVFRVKLSKDADEHLLDSTCLEATVTGKRGRTVKIAASKAGRDSEGCLLLPVELSTVEMAETVKASLLFEGAELAQQETSMSELLAAAGNGGESNQADLARATANAGYYLQRHLAGDKGQRADHGYAEMDLRFDDALQANLAAKELGSYAMLEAGDRSGVGKVTMSVSFGPTATVDMRIAPAKGYKGALSAMVEMGERALPATLEKDGRLHVRIEGIAPKDFDKTFRVNVMAEHSCRLEASVLTYAAAAIQKEDVTPEGHSAMAAVYRLWQACK